MKTEQNVWMSSKGWEKKPNEQLKSKVQLAFLFGSTALLKNPEFLSQVKAMYPQAQIFGCSTSGEIYGTRVLDDTLVLTAVYLEYSRYQLEYAKINNAQDSFKIGELLVQRLNPQGLVHVLVLSEGLGVNGSLLVQGLLKNLPQGITVTGGLSGDGDRFKETLVVCGQEPQHNAITIVGFYGDRLKVGYGSLGGWDPFGPERAITRSVGNVLYELDGKSALELYKKYLGDHAKGLPATGLLFPLSLRLQGQDVPVVRTILGIDEASQSMTFAGDMPTGAYARFMKANFNRIIDGAVGAAKTSLEAIGSGSPDLALLISCVGRKLILKQRIEEEVEGVRDVLGERTTLMGFYSYGEISPFTPGAKCELHNQTMTITTLTEK